MSVCTYCFRTYSVYLSFRLFAPAGQKSTSLLRGRQGRFRAVYRFNAAIISAFRTSSFTMSYEHNHRRNQWYCKGCREHHEQFSAAESNCLEHRLQRRNIHRAQNYRRFSPQLYPRLCRGIYRAKGAVISTLRVGYIFCPLGKKLMCVRCAHTF